jgi:uncharacterized protein YjiK
MALTLASSFFPAGMRAMTLQRSLRILPPEMTAQSESQLARYTFAEEPPRWRLPDRLSEISGLAVTPDDRVFAHDDERAVIYEVDLREGRLKKAFGLGSPLVRADFEGLEIVDGRFFLVTSDGQLYESREGEDDERLGYNVYLTGVGRLCEVEGLSVSPDDRQLLLLCKTPRTSSVEGRITIFRWSIDSHTIVQQSTISLPDQAFRDGVGGRGFRPSGLAKTPEGDHYFLVSARQPAIAEISLDGRVWGVRSLSRRTHPQAEGVAVLSDGTLLVADEGAGRGGRLATYVPNPGSQ